MIEDCDVELFMVLPRLVVLCFLDKPLGARTELVRSLLPHRFGPVSEGSGQTLRLDSELKVVYDRFKETMTLLTSSIAPASTPSVEARRSAWETIVRQAVIGEEADVMRHACLGGAALAESRKTIAELLHSVERWSLELQRHCPEDWNQCSAILVHCLTGGTQKDSPSKFQV